MYTNIWELFNNSSSKHCSDFRSPRYFIWWRSKRNDSLIRYDGLWMSFKNSCPFSLSDRHVTRLWKPSRGNFCIRQYMAVYSPRHSRGWVRWWRKLAVLCGFWECNPATTQLRRPRFKRNIKSWSLSSSKLYYTIGPFVPWWEQKS